MQVHVHVHVYLSRHCVGQTVVQFRCTLFEFIGQTRSSSTSQLSPNSSFSASSPNQSASYLSPERTYPSSTSVGASGSFNNSYDSGSKVSWTVGGSESIDGKGQNEPLSDSVTLQAGTTNLINQLFSTFLVHKTRSQINMCIWSPSVSGTCISGVYMYVSLNYFDSVLAPLCCT